MIYIYKLFLNEKWSLGRVNANSFENAFKTIKRVYDIDGESTIVLYPDNNIICIENKKNE